MSINHAKCRAIELKCEGLVAPLSIGRTAPEFSWLFDQAGKDRIQTAYRIVVSKADVKNPGKIWDTGKVASGATTLIPYAGKPLASRTRYTWKVKVWDGDGHESPFSKPAFFETGILDAVLWTGIWIGGHDLLRKSFSIPADVAEARATIACVGYYELRINGQKIGDQQLAPSHTDYEKRVEYHIHDVTVALQRGENAVGIMLGHGFPLTVPFEKKSPDIMLQMDITLCDGTVMTLVTDESWTGSAGPIVENSVYNGEVYDARLEKAGWDCPGYAEKWEKAAVVEPPAGILVPQMIPPIRAIREMKPVAIEDVTDTIQRVDIGQNMVGWARLTVDGEAGTEIIMKFGEVLNADGTVNLCYYWGAASTDRYILKGGGPETFEPRFTFHGFRYIQVENYPGKLTADRITAVYVCSDVEEIGRFSCSNPTFNKIHSMMKWTFHNNMHSMPTDCPQRDERRGWMADAHVASEACICNFDMLNFYRKWMDDIQDVQDPDTGAMFYPMAPKWIKFESVPWQSAYIIIPWNLYVQYGDTRTLTEHYPGMKAYMQYLAGKMQDGLLKMEEPFNDWLNVVNTAPELTINIFYYLDLGLMADMARLLGLSEDAALYDSRREEIKAALHQKHQTHSGFYSQTATVFYLWLGLADPEDRDKFMERLVYDLLEVRGKNHLTTGILGTKYLIELLAANGKSDLVYDLFMQKEYPSWGFMIRHGATTIWERWEHMTIAGMNSHDHPALGAPDTWFFKHLAGIRSHAEKNGRRFFQISPTFLKDIKGADASIKTPWGKVAVDWKCVKSGIILDIAIPANTAADITLELPGGAAFSLASDGLNVPAGEAGRGESQIRADLSVGSGQYRLILTPAAK